MMEPPKTKAFDLNCNDNGIKKDNINLVKQ